MNKTFINLFVVSKGILVCLTLLVLLTSELSAQDRFTSIEAKLNSMIPDIPSLDEKINISVSDVPIQEFIRGIANNANININIDPNIKIRITNNYTQVRIIDILLFICKQFNLDINATGSILSIVSYNEPVVEKPKPVKKELKISYNQSGDLVTLDLYNDSLCNIARKLTDLTQRNIIVSPDLNNQLISGYIKNTTFDAALNKLLYTNKLSVTKTKDNFYIIDRPDQNKSKEANPKSALSKGRSNNNEDDETSFNLLFHSQNTFSVKCSQTPLLKLIKAVSDTLNISYSIVDDLDGIIDLNLTNVDYEEFLKRVFIGGAYGYRSMNGYYMIGKNDNPLLKTSKIIKLQHRTVDKIMDIFPEDIAGKLVIKEFAEQNSLIVIGSSGQIQKFEAFINEIDKVVPLVLIEILIVEVNKTKSVSFGINAGIGANPNNPTNHVISPGVNYDLSTQTINDVLAKMTGVGWINLGRVSPNFYFNIKALEDDGKVIIRSTPKLATLNGHEASLSNGEKRYYKEEKSNFIGTQNPTLSSSYTWTQITADLKITIKPFVSGNDQITLDIVVDQSQFTKSETVGAPPGSVTRNFKSLIRMKNQEMVLLGGLDNFSSTNTSQGLPLLARIPIIKWLFGSTSRSKTDTKLNLFIQPTIIY